MLLPRLVLRKMKKAKRSCIAGPKDMRNAFGTGTHERLVSRIHKRCDEKRSELVKDMHEIVANVHKEHNETVKGFFTQRRTEVSFLLNASDRDMVMKPGSGGLMGCSNEPEAFMDSFYACVKN